MGLGVVWRLPFFVLFPLTGRAQTFKFNVDSEPYE